MKKKGLFLIISSVFLAFCVLFTASCGGNGESSDENGGEVKTTYTVSFDSDGGSEVAAKTLAEGDNYVFETSVKEDFVFIGWYLGEDKVATSGVWKIKSDVTLKAKWAAAKSTITFVTNTEEELDAIVVNYGEYYTLPQLERENYIFIGWYFESEKWENGDLLFGDITLTAQWESISALFDYVEANGEITITAYNGTGEAVAIPAAFNGVPITNIAQDAFKNNTNITSVSFDGGFVNYPEKLFEGCIYIESLTLSGSYDKPLYYLFGDDVSAVPEELTRIRFAKNSPTYSNEIFKSSLTNYEITHIIDYDGANFEGCTYLQNVVIARGESIGDNEFAGCSNLEDITIPGSVTSIGANAFSGCESLSNITLPDGVTSIGAGAFNGCANLISMIIPDGVTSIGALTFNGCANLKKILIPNSVLTIGEDAFLGCSRLSNLYYKGTQEDWANVDIDIDNSALHAANRYYYSETEPEEDNAYWHFVDGSIVIWMKSSDWTNTH